MQTFERNLVFLKNQLILIGHYINSALLTQCKVKEFKTKILFIVFTHLVVIISQGPRLGLLKCPYLCFFGTLLLQERHFPLSGQLQISNRGP